MADSSDRKAIKVKKDRQRRDQVTNDLITRTLMGDKEGRRYVWLKLAEGNIFSSTICFGEDGFARTAFLEGKRATALALLSDCMRISAINFTLMMQENSRLENTNGGPSDSSSGGTSPSSGPEPGSDANPIDADDDPIERFADANLDSRDADNSSGAGESD